MSQRLEGWVGLPSIFNILIVLILTIRFNDDKLKNRKEVING